jgi:hypothetical protein
MKMKGDTISVERKKLSSMEKVCKLFWEEIESLIIHSNKIDTKEKFELVAEIKDVLNSKPD